MREITTKTATPFDAEAMNNILINELPKIPDASSSIDAIWDFMCDMDEPQMADAILCLCSFDTSVADVTAQVYKRGCAPWVVVSGGLAHQSDVAQTGWNRPEADVFAEILEEQGVPASRIIREREAKNTGENFKLSLLKMEEAKVKTHSVLCVQKPYMLRRSRLTGQIAAPNSKLSMYSEKIGASEYLQRDTDPVRTINVIVGDLHRIMVYPRLGFQSPQHVPDDIVQAGRCLIELGFSKHLLEGEMF